jgi:hypothetical protein
MGYDTAYKLDVKFGLGTDVVEVPASIKHRLLAKLTADNGEADYALLSANGETNNRDARWYDHEKDMRKFSVHHPDFLFVLSGEGEESGDIWTLYAKAGKVRKEKAVLTVAPYDPDKLT